MSPGHKFRATGDWLKRLDGEERRRAIPPERVVHDMDLHKTDRVADLGAGVGFFAFPMAAKAESVVCVDMEKKMLAVLRDRIREKGVKNILALRGNIQEPPIADASVDHVLAAFVYHEVDDPRILLYECGRIMRPTGLLTIVDFQKHAPVDIGPPESVRVTPEQVIRSCSTQFVERSRVEDDVYYQIAFSKKGCAVR